MPVWGFSAPTPVPEHTVPELWQTCVCGTNSAISWWSWGLLPSPLYPSPESYKCPVSPGVIPSPQQAQALQLPICETPAVMAAFARHCMENPGCLFLHHGSNTLARAAPGVGNHPPRHSQLFPSCTTSSHTQHLPSTSFSFSPPGKKRPSL